MTPEDRRQEAASMFLTLAGDGAAEPEDQRSVTRRAVTILITSLLGLLPVLWAVSTQSADASPEAVLTKQAAVAEDDDGEASGDGTDTRSNRGTGKETRGNTDRGGQNTGGSTRGETDGRDATGKSERTQGTGKETRGNTDRAGRDTGAKTRNDTDGDGSNSTSGAGTDTGDDGGDDGDDT
jgi:hypothetical protein